VQVSENMFWYICLKIDIYVSKIIKKHIII